jgi:hypothetical protein
MAMLSDSDVLEAPEETVLPPFHNRRAAPRTARPRFDAHLSKNEVRAEKTMNTTTTVEATDPITSGDDLLLEFEALSPEDLAEVGGGQGSMMII